MTGCRSLLVGVRSDASPNSIIEPFWKVLQAICDTVPACVAAIDVEYKFVVFNKSFEVFAGINRQELLGRDISEFCLDEAIQYPLSQALTTGLQVVSNEITIMLHNGRTVDFSVDAIPIFNEKGMLFGTIGIYKDMTQVRETERRMQHLEAQAAIGHMAAGTVHEIRNSLTSIKGFTQLSHARAMRQQDPVLAEYCELISGEVKHINSVVSDFLALAKPNDKGPVLLDIVQVVADVVNFMYVESLLAGITINHQVEQEQLHVEGNPEKLKEVLINICRNAFQAMDLGGKLTVAVNGDEEAITIIIQDNGIGMDADTLDKIFRPFFTTKETGTGLGLVICQRIVNEHGGRITVDSAIGEGTAFTLMFPRKNI